MLEAERVALDGSLAISNICGQMKRTAEDALNSAGRNSELVDGECRRLYLSAIQALKESDASFDDFLLVARHRQYVTIASSLDVVFLEAVKNSMRLTPDQRRQIGCAAPEKSMVNSVLRH